MPKCVTLQNVLSLEVLYCPAAAAVGASNASLLPNPAAQGPTGLTHTLTVSQDGKDVKTKDKKLCHMGY